MNAPIATYFDLQPTHLKNELIELRPLQATDFESLYQIASDPLIWEQHPIKNRYQRPAFETFFSDGITSRGAFLILDARLNKAIGSTRYYDYDQNKKQVAIGYTFLSRDRWGTLYNRALKMLMLDYAFNFVDTVIFHIGSENIRSQKAILKLGSKKRNDIEEKYLEGQKVIHYIYEITKEEWKKIRESKKLTATE
jgi:RimJ/RimL family protein N-acetyltransferase